MRRIFLIILTAMTIVLVAALAPAQTITAPLFASYAGPVELPKVDSSLVLRQRLVTVRLDSIQMEPGGVLLLNLFDDLQVEAVCVAAGEEMLGSLSWHGVGVDGEDVQVHLAVGERSISGHVHVPGSLFHIRPLDDGVHVIREILVPVEQGRSKRTRQARLDAEWESAGLVNQERRINGLRDLAWDDKLFAAARGHAADMASKNYYDHDSLDGRTAGQRITNAGYIWNAWRENIAAGQTTSAIVHNAWMNSPGHRKNILDALICDIGVGYAYSGASQHKHYWTQKFARKQGVSTCPAVNNPPLPGPQPGPDPGPDPDPKVLNNLGWVNAFYVAYWGRSPDSDGLAYWMDMVNSGRLNTAEVAEVFAMSDEAKAMYAYFRSPGTATDAQRGEFIRAVYRNLLNREADASGLNYWVGELRTGASTPGLAIGNIINAAMSAGSTDWLVIRNKVEVANYFAWRFGQRNYRWDDNARNAAVRVLQGVTSDPATVTAGKAWIDQIMS
ncbi:MAG: DUF4214 domain-containing protein [Desulfovibrionales bacterium]|nr:MAG: DUF4214 domain-containing protein [Desulfovibrionales bacterium]